MTAHRVHTSGTLAPRMSEARRNAIHGPLVPMDEPPLNRWIIICPPLAVGLFLATVEILR